MEEGVAAIQEIDAGASRAFTAAFRELDRDVRPVQISYFKCCLEASAPSRGPELVPDGIAACQAPLRRVQEALAGAQEGYQNRVRACHGAAAAAFAAGGGSGGGGDSGDKPPTPAQLAQYAAALRPCVEKEQREIGGLLAGVRSLVPAALSDIAAAAPKKAGWW
jgi:hypothetical protein